MTRRYRTACTFIVRGDPTRTTRRYLCTAPLIQDRGEEVRDLPLGCPLGCPAFVPRTGSEDGDEVQSNEPEEPAGPEEPARR